MPPPKARVSDQGLIPPDQSEFSGFVFKVQANMDRSHHDRVAFVRVCSGRFERGMKVHHVRLGRDIRLANPSQFLAQERSLIDEAYAGDVIGIHDPGSFEIGDTLTGGTRFRFPPIPSFAPEHFARVVMANPLKRKQFSRGIEQLAQEGAVQLYRPLANRAGDLVLGAVGQLQLEVVKHRLRTEYGVDIRLEPVPHHFARWVSRNDGRPLDLKALEDAWLGTVVLDVRDRPVLLFEGEWAIRSAEKLRPDLVLAETAHGVVMRDG